MPLLDTYNASFTLLAEPQAQIEMRTASSKKEYLTGRVTEHSWFYISNETQDQKEEKRKRKNKNQKQNYLILLASPKHLQQRQ